MTMPPRLRKLGLFAHVIASVGWLGAVVVFIALAIVAMTSPNDQTVRGVYLVMEPAALYVLIPLGFAALVTGIVQSLGTAWGLFRHYWVLFSLLINVVAIVVLLSYLETFGSMAGAAADPTTTTDELRALASSPLLHAVLALVLLLAATVLGMYKPRGLTRYGLRKQRDERDRHRNQREQAALSRP